MSFERTRERSEFTYRIDGEKPLDHVHNPAAGQFSPAIAMLVLLNGKLDQFFIEGPMVSPRTGKLMKNYGMTGWDTEDLALPDDHAFSPPRWVKDLVIHAGVNLPPC